MLSLSVASVALLGRTVRVWPSAAAPGEAGGSAGRQSAARRRPGDWGQWGGSSVRNNTPEGKNIPTEWTDRHVRHKTGEWNKDDAKNIKWVGRARLAIVRQPRGGQRPGLRRHQQRRRLPEALSGHASTWACCSASDEKDGKFLWQHSNEKLPTGRVHDWPLQGVCAAPLVEGERLWYVTNRGEVVCLDAKGFYDDKDDGPVTERARPAVRRR